jgi:hypothetical protein
MKTIEFEHDIGDRVCVAQARDIEGCVAGMSINVNGATYRVIWWQDGKRQDEWLFGWEIAGKGAANNKVSGPEPAAKGTR